MAFKKPLAEKCRDCLRIDRESYKGAGIIVCYHLEKRDGKSIAREVKESRPACGNYRGKVN